MSEARYSPDPGADMLERHLQGDENAFAELIDSFGARVLGYLRRCGMQPEEADDLFQETFLRVHRSARAFDRRWPFQAWLFAIARNLVRGELRKKKVRRIMVGLLHRTGRGERAEAEMDPADPATGPEERVAARRTVEELEKQIASLPANLRDALLLVCVQNFKLDQAARALGVPTPTLKTWLRRARLSLMEMSESGQGEER